MVFIFSSHQVIYEPILAKRGQVKLLNGNKKDRQCSSQIHAKSSLTHFVYALTTSLYEGTFKGCIFAIAKIEIEWPNHQMRWCRMACSFHSRSKKCWAKLSINGYRFFIAQAALQRDRILLSWTRAKFVRQIISAGVAWTIICCGLRRPLKVLLSPRQTSCLDIDSHAT